MNETFAFNFEWFSNENYQTLKEELYQYMSSAEIKEFEDYIKILTVNGSTNEQKIAAINDMYANIKGLSRFLSDHMMEANDIEEYRTFSRYFRALFYSKETDTMFQIEDHVTGETRAASTFLEYLNYENPILGEFVETVDRDECHLYIDHVINRMEAVLNDLSYLYIINNTTSSLQEVLIELIRFFKSYTTDMIGLNVVYIFDFKPDNMLKLIDRMERIEKTLNPIDKLYFGYSDAISHMDVTTRMIDPMILRDYMEVHIKIRLLDYLRFEDILKLIKHLSAEDRFKLIDDIFVHGHVYMTDNLKSWRDLVVYIHSEKLLEDVLNLIDEILIKKTFMTTEQLGIFDAARINKTLVQNEQNFIMKDACYVVNVY